MTDPAPYRPDTDSVQPGYTAAGDYDPLADAIGAYHEACRLARDGNEAVRAWFDGREQ